MRLGHLHAFFQRIIAWDYDDAPPRNPVLTGDRPILDKPLPRFLDDPSAAKLLQAARALPEEFDRLAVELLARTGMRKGELLGLTIDAVVQIGSAFWLRTPVGKMRNDRYIPLHPTLKTMIDGWLTRRPTWQSSDLLFTDRGRPIPPSRVDKAVQRAADAAGLGHVHPHQLRHTLATQAINRGMSLEAIAALLGHYAGDRCQEAASSRRVRRPSKTFCRPIWPLAAASSRWRSRVGLNSMVVWKNVHDSQIDSK
jgi:integrase